MIRHYFSDIRQKAEMAPPVRFPLVFSGTIGNTGILFYPARAWFF